MWDDQDSELDAAACRLACDADETCSFYLYKDDDDTPSGSNPVHCTAFSSCTTYITYEDCSDCDNTVTVWEKMPS